MFSEARTVSGSFWMGSGDYGRLITLAGSDWVLADERYIGSYRRLTFCVARI